MDHQKEKPSIIVELNGKMKYKALSIVYPNCQLIVEKKKTIEVRSWLPPK